MAEKIKFTVLGTASAIPTAKRNHVANLLTFGGENILIDCGEGTQRQFRLAKLNPCKITKILITHWHGDHVLGLPGLLQTMAFSEYQKGLTLYGPVGTKKFMGKMFEMFVFEDKFPLKIVELDKPGIFFENDEFFLECEKMVHGTGSLAYNFVRKGYSRLDKEKLKKSKLPPGAHLKKLQGGSDLFFEGNEYKAKDFVYSQKELKVSYIGDTRVNDKMKKFVENADLFICESTYRLADEDLARKAKHMTAAQAAKIAKDANVKKLVLTHFSQRNQINMKALKDEARAIFENTKLAKDLDSFEVA